MTSSADLGIAKAAMSNPVVAGRPLSYQITVTNNGPSTATGVVVTDPLSSVLAFTSATSSTPNGTCGLQVNTNVVQCQLGTLNPGESGVVYIYAGVSPSATGPIANTATVSSATPDPNSRNDASTANTTVIKSADVGIVLTSDKDVYKPSTVIHYTITVTNAGASDASNVVVTQLLPAVKMGRYVSNNIGCPAPVGTTFTCSLATIPAGGTRTFQLDFLIRGNKGTISSTVSVATATSDPNAVNNSSTRIVTVK